MVQKTSLAFGDVYVLDSWASGCVFGVSLKSSSPQMAFAHPFLDTNLLWASIRLHSQQRAWTLRPPSELRKTSFMANTSPQTLRTTQLEA